MADRKIKKLSERTAINQIVNTIKWAKQGEAPFALVLGSGFSHGLVPVASELVGESLPLWMKSLVDGQSYEDVKQLSPGERTAIAKNFWRGFVDQNSEQEGFNLPLNSQTGLPENYADAYQAAFNTDYDGAVNTPKLARDFQLALMQLTRPRLNAAHFLLASLLGVQPGKTSRQNYLFKAKAAFSRLILTTNFDPFLQTALQAVNKLYFMSDTPELGVSDEIYDDQSDAIHLVYLHGSVHRRDQAASKAAIDDIKKRNATILAPVLERHGVIVLGYSGWDDAIVEALAACGKFDNRLYWCGREADPLAQGAFGDRVPEILLKPATSYVQVPSAGGFMAQLCRELVEGLPRLIENPIGQLRELLDIIDLKELEEQKPPVSAASNVPQLLQSGSVAMAVVQAKQLTIERLKHAEQVFLGTIPSSPVVETIRETPEKPAGDGRVGEVQVLESKSKSQQLLASARLALGLGNYEECLKFCNEALSLTSLEIPDRAKLMQWRALAHYYLGSTSRAKEDWGEVIELPGAPAEQVAQALYNRGVTFGQEGDTDKEVADYTRVIELPGAGVEQVAEALYNRGLAWGQQEETAKEIADYSRALELPDVSIEQMAQALINRGVAWGQQNDTEKEMGDYARVIDELTGVPAEQLGQALYNRGVAWGHQGDTEKALADYTRVIDLPGAPAEYVALALYNRGITWGQQGDTEKEIADYTRVVDLPGALVEQVAEALYNRGLAWGEQGDSEKEIADYTRVIELKGVSVEQMAQALYDRAVAWGQQGDTEKRIADYSNLIELAGAPGELVAEALYNRAVAWGQQGDTGNEIADYTRLINLPGAPVEQVVQALYNRGVAWGQQGDTEKEMADYTQVIESAGAQVEQVAQALYNRAVAWGQQGDTEKEIVAYTQVIELDGARVEQVAQALYNRAVAWGEKGDLEKEMGDYTRLIELPGAPAEQRADALYNRGIGWGMQGDLEKEMADYSRVIELRGAPVEAVAQALSGQGWVAYQKNDFAGFLVATEAALDKDAGLDFAMFNLGLALLSCGRDEDALTAYRIAAERFPESIDTLGLEDLKEARQKWLTDERAQPVIHLLESLKK